MFEEEAITQVKFYVWTHTATGQHHIENSLAQRKCTAIYSFYSIQLWFFCTFCSIILTLTIKRTKRCIARTEVCVEMITDIQVITPTVQPSSQRTSLKFLDRLELLLRKHTLIIFTGRVPSPVAGGTLAEASTDLDMLVEDMPLHDKVLVSPDITHAQQKKHGDTYASMYASACNEILRLTASLSPFSAPVVLEIHMMGCTKGGDRQQSAHYHAGASSCTPPSAAVPPYSPVLHSHCLQHSRPSKSISN